MTNRVPELGGMKVCLVFPPYRESDDPAFLSVTKKNLGKIPPLSLCAAAAALEERGCRVKIIDANATDAGIAAVAREAADFSPDLLGFTLATYQFDFTLKWIEGVRRGLSCPVIVGGHHARIYPREILAHRGIDYCITGEAEAVIPDFLSSLTGKCPLKEVRGIAYRDPAGGEIRVNPEAAYVRDLDTVPFPSRHLLDNSRYYSLISRDKNFTAMTTSRGCAFQCTFCDNHCLPYRAMSPKRVVDEMEQCRREFSIKEFDMFDGVFSVDKARLLRICAEVGKRKLKIRWSIRTRTDLLDKECLVALKKAGCARIYYGIESGSVQVLEKIKKGTDLEHAAVILKATRNAGIDTFGYFMVGAPGETVETLKLTRDLMFSLPLDYAQFTPIFYAPNTELYAEVMKEIKYDYWREYTVDPEKKIVFPVVGTEFSRDQVNAQVRKLYLDFYLRPRYLWKFIARINSWAEAARALKAVSDMARAGGRQG